MSLDMETYLRRTYGHTKTNAKGEFPFWDYRSRRGTFSSSSCGLSSGGSSCDGSSISSASTSTRSDPGSESSTSLSDQSDTDSLMPCDLNKMSIQFTTDTNDVSFMEELYQPILNWIDPDLRVLKITDNSDCLENTLTTSLSDISARLPSMALMLFLQEDGMVGFERMQTVKRNFEKCPWKFHHSEQVHRGSINPYPYNSRDFYYTSEDLPLWAVRQVHTGKEFFRTLLFVGESNWQAMIQFYKLVLNIEPDVKREDFCLFTVSSFAGYDVQLALKKLQGDMKPRVLEGVKLQFRAADISNLISLLPNICHPISDTRWQTTDIDGNMVILEIPRIGSQNNSSFSISDRSSLSNRSSISERNSSMCGGSFIRRCQTPDIRSNSDICQDRTLTGSRRKNTPKTERTRSLIADDIKHKIKQGNNAYQQSMVRAIKEKQATLQRSSSEPRSVGETDKDNLNTPNDDRLTPVSSFYV